MKRLYCIIWTLFFTISLSACGTQATQTPPEPATATSTSVPPTETATATEIPPTPTSSPTSTATAIVEVISTEASALSISFVNDVMPIFNNNCLKCHGGEEIKKGMDLRTYDSLMKGSFNGSVIMPGSADNSFLVEQLLNGEMPKRKPKLPDDQIQIIIDWVNQGAINN